MKTRTSVLRQVGGPFFYKESTAPVIAQRTFPLRRDEVLVRIRAADPRDLSPVNDKQLRPLPKWSPVSRHESCGTSPVT